MAGRARAGKDVLRTEAMSNAIGGFWGRVLIAPLMIPVKIAQGFSALKKKLKGK